MLRNCDLEDRKVNCEYFEKDGLCASYVDYSEVKTARELNCKNDKKMTCCYLCSRQNTCDISCNYLVKPEKIQISARQLTIK
jgi:hypothetical protein